MSFMQSTFSEISSHQPIRSQAQIKRDQENQRIMSEYETLHETIRAVDAEILRNTRSKPDILVAVEHEDHPFLMSVRELCAMFNVDPAKFAREHVLEVMKGRTPSYHIVVDPDLVPGEVSFEACEPPC